MPSFAEQMRQYFKQNARTREHTAHSAKVHSVAWNHDGNKLASGSYDQTASVFVLDRDRLVSCLDSFHFDNDLLRLNLKFSSCSCYYVFCEINFHHSFEFVLKF